MSLETKRVYEAPDKQDGKRILVDRLWPRGLSREAASLDDWMKDIAPSDKLRQWFGHRPERWEAFRTAYMKELEQHREPLERLAKLASKVKVTLLFAAKDEHRNNAVVIEEWISSRKR